jgi:hypothetical protein
VRRDAESLEQVPAGRLTLAGEPGVVDPDELAAHLITLPSMNTVSTAAAPP